MTEDGAGNRFQCGVERGKLNQDLLVVNALGEAFEQPFMVVLLFQADN
jgi:hypothetical protein